MTPQYLSDEQIDQIKVLKAQGKSLEEIKSYLTGNAMGTFSSVALEKNELPQLTENPWQKKSLSSELATGAASLLTDLPQDVTDLGRGVRRVGGDFLDNAKEAFTKEGITLPSRGAGLISAGVSAGTGLVGEAVMGGLRAVATPGQEQAVAGAVEQGVQAIADTDTVKSAVSWFDSQDEQTKYNISRLMLPAADLVTTVAPVGIVKGVLNKLRGKATPEVPPVDVGAKLSDVMARADKGDASDAVKVVNSTLDEATRAAEVEKLATSLQTSLVGDRKAVNRKLQEQAADMSRGGVLVSQDDLVKALADEGIVPDVRGAMADFSVDIRRLDDRQDELFAAYRPILEQNRSTVSIEDFSNMARASVKESPQITATLNPTLRQVDDVMDSYRQKFGDTLTAAQIDQISRDANRLSKANKNTDAFQADMYSELGRAARTWLEKNIPDEAFKKTNQEWLRLEQLKNTAEIFQREPIDVGLFGRALGSYVTTLTGATMGMAAGGPVGSVAIAILTKMGGDAFADSLRQIKFSPELRAQLQQRLSRDAKLRDELKATATTQENKNLIDDLSRMLPAPKDGYRSSVSPGAKIYVDPAGNADVGKRGLTREMIVGGAIKRSDSDGTAPLIKGIVDDENQQARMEALRQSQAGQPLGLPDGSNSRPFNSSDRPFLVSPEGEVSKSSQTLNPREKRRPNAIQRSDSEGQAPLVKTLLDTEQEVVDNIRTQMLELSTTGMSKTESGYIRYTTFPQFVPKDFRDSDLFSRVWNHIENNTVPRANAGREIELMEIIKSEINRRTFDKLNAQQNTDITSGDLPFSILLAVGAGAGAYYMMQENGELAALPVMASMAAMPGGKKVIAKGLDDVIEQLDTVVKNTKDETVRARTQTALDSAKAEKAKLDSFQEGEIPETKLAEEAKKYKSAEEFEASLRSRILVHGGKGELEGGKLGLGKSHGGQDAGGIFFAENTSDGLNYARGYTLKGDNFKGKIHKAILNPNVRIFDFTNPADREVLRKAISKQEFDLYIESGNGKHFDWAQTPDPDLIAELGYQGMKVRERQAGFNVYDESFKQVPSKDDIVAVQVFSPDSFEMLPDSVNLIDIWNKANETKP